MNEEHSTPGSDAAESTGRALSSYVVYDPGTVPVEDNGHEERVALAEELLLSNDGLHYLAQYGRGIRQFDIDVLSAVAENDGPDGAEQRRAGCRRIARKLSFQSTVHLDDWVADLQTGPLIRTVLETSAGAIYCDRVVPGTFLVGATVAMGETPSPLLARPDVERSDSALALLISEIRRRLILSSQDLGGWESEQIRERLRNAEREALAASVAETITNRVVTPVVDGEWHQHPAVALCRDKIHPRDLHLVALFDEGTLVFSVDVFNDERILIDRPGTVTAAARRGRYQDKGLELPAYIRELARTARGVIGGPLQRAVLDVEQGAIYYRRLDNFRYVMGVTLFQDQVKQAENLLAEICSAWPNT